MRRLAWKPGIGILVLAFSVALGVQATLPQAAAGQQAATGTGPLPTVDQGLTDPALLGALDVHAHMAPDRTPRSIDPIDLAKLAKARGMRGFVIKEPFESSAGLAYLTRKEVPGVEVFGAITLNFAVGGMNAEAVRHMATVKGGWGRIVWMPTVDSEDGARSQHRPFVAVSRNGELLPEVKEVLAVIARTRTADSNGELVLATGHSPPEESLMLLQEARNQGVKHMVVTHPLPYNDNRENWTLAHLQAAAKLGAFIEVRTQTLPTDPGGLRIWKPAAEMIRQIGIENCLIATDLGVAGRPFHPDGLAITAKWLRSQGFTDQELNRLMKENPARLLGLPPE